MSKSYPMTPSFLGSTYIDLIKDYELSLSQIFDYNKDWTSQRKVNNGYAGSSAAGFPGYEATIKNVYTTLMDKANPFSTTKSTATAGDIPINAMGYAGNYELVQGFPKDRGFSYAIPKVASGVGDGFSTYMKYIEYIWDGYSNNYGIDGKHGYADEYEFVTFDPHKFNNELNYTEDLQTPSTMWIRVRSDPDNAWGYINFDKTVFYDRNPNYSKDEYLFYDPATFKFIPRDTPTGMRPRDMKKIGNWYVICGGGLNGGWVVITKQLSTGEGTYMHYCSLPLPESSPNLSCIGWELIAPSSTRSYQKDKTFLVYAKDGSAINCTINLDSDGDFLQLTTELVIEGTYADEYHPENEYRGNPITVLFNGVSAVLPANVDLYTAADNIGAFFTPYNWKSTTIQKINFPSLYHIYDITEYQNCLYLVGTLTYDTNVVIYKSTNIYDWELVSENIYQKAYSRNDTVYNAAIKIIDGVFFVALGDINYNSVIVSNDGGTTWSIGKRTQTPYYKVNGGGEIGHYANIPFCTYDERSDSFIICHGGFHSDAYNGGGWYPPILSKFKVKYTPVRHAPLFTLTTTKTEVTDSGPNATRGRSFATIQRIGSNTSFDDPQLAKNAHIHKYNSLDDYTDERFRVGLRPVYNPDGTLDEDFLYGTQVPSTYEQESSLFMHFIYDTTEHGVYQTAHNVLSQMYCIPTIAKNHGGLRLYVSKNMTLIHNHQLVADGDWETFAPGFPDQILSTDIAPMSDDERTTWVDPGYKDLIVDTYSKYFAPLPNLTYLIMKPSLLNAIYTADGDMTIRIQAYSLYSHEAIGEVTFELDNEDDFNTALRNGFSAYCDASGEIVIYLNNVDSTPVVIGAGQSFETLPPSTLDTYKTSDNRKKEVVGNPLVGRKYNKANNGDSIYSITSSTPISLDAAIVTQDSTTSSAGAGAESNAVNISFAFGDGGKYGERETESYDSISLYIPNSVAVLNNIDVDYSSNLIGANYPEIDNTVGQLFHTKYPASIRKNNLVSLRKGDRNYSDGNIQSNTSGINFDRIFHVKGTTYGVLDSTGRLYTINDDGTSTIVAATVYNSRLSTVLGVTECGSAIIYYGTNSSGYFTYFVSTTRAYYTTTYIPAVWNNDQYKSHPSVISMEDGIAFILLVQGTSSSLINRSYWHEAIKVSNLNFTFQALAIDSACELSGFYPVFFRESVVRCIQINDSYSDTYPTYYMYWNAIYSNTNPYGELVLENYVSKSGAAFSLDGLNWSAVTNDSFNIPYYAMTSVTEVSNYLYSVDEDNDYEKTSRLYAWCFEFQNDDNSGNYTAPGLYYSDDGISWTAWAQVNNDPDFPFHGRNYCYCVGVGDKLVLIDSAEDEEESTLTERSILVINNDGTWNEAKFISDLTEYNPILGFPYSHVIDTATIEDGNILVGIMKCKVPGSSSTTNNYFEFDVEAAPDTIIFDNDKIVSTMRTVGTKVNALSSYTTFMGKSMTTANVKMVDNPSVARAAKPVRLVGYDNQENHVWYHPEDEVFDALYGSSASYFSFSTFIALNPEGRFFMDESLNLGATNTSGISRPYMVFDAILDDNNKMKYEDITGGWGAGYITNEYSLWAHNDARYDFVNNQWNMLTMIHQYGPSGIRTNPVLDHYLYTKVKPALTAGGTYSITSTEGSLPFPDEFSDFRWQQKQTCNGIFFVNDHGDVIFTKDMTSWVWTQCDSHDKSPTCIEYVNGQFIAIYPPNYNKTEGAMTDYEQTIEYCEASDLINNLTTELGNSPITPWKSLQIADHIMNVPVDDFGNTRKVYVGNLKNDGVNVFMTMVHETGMTTHDVSLKPYGYFLIGPLFTVDDFLAEPDPVWGYKYIDENIKFIRADGIADVTKALHVGQYLFWASRDATDFDSYYLGYHRIGDAKFGVKNIKIPIRFYNYGETETNDGKTISGYMKEVCNLSFPPDSKYTRSKDGVLAKIDDTHFAVKFYQGTNDNTSTRYLHHIDLFELTPYGDFDY